MSVDNRLELAISLARHAGQLLREGFGRGTEVRYKGPIDPVTEYDLASEALLRNGIRTAFPRDAIVGEENGGSVGDQGCWYLDPLDGTVNFSHGIPVFSVSVGYAQDGHPVVGVIYDPLRDELFSASKGKGAWLNGERLHVSSVSTLQRSLLVTGFPYSIRSAVDNNLGHYAAFMLKTQGVRRLGSASLDLAYVAAGRFDGYWELAVEAWDVAAGIVLVEEAGGLVTQAHGGPHPFRPPLSILATNGRLHPAMLEVLGDAS